MTTKGVNYTIVLTNTGNKTLTNSHDRDKILIFQMVYAALFVRR